MSQLNQFIGLDYRQSTIKAPFSNKIRKRSQSELFERGNVVNTFNQVSGVMLKGTVSKRGSSSRISTVPSIFQNSLHQRKFIERLNHLNSLPITPLSSYLHLNPPLRPIQEQPVCLPKKCKLQDLKKDKEKHPIKYKILCEKLGLDQAKVMHMDEASLQKEGKLYIWQKGIEYLKESREKAKSQKYHCKSGSLDNAKKCNLSSKKDKDYIRQIFKEVAQKERQKAEARLILKRKQSQNAQKGQKLLQHQERLGHNVYKRVLKHLHMTHQHKLSYIQQISGQQKVDDSLIKFIHFKIKRLSTVAQ